jgi:uncharacterized protein (DUF1697 family)
MARYVALLRGINVGKAKRVPMAELRDMLERMGYTEVHTLLNSGNVVFDAKSGATNAHAGKIAKAIEQTFGFEVPTVVKSAAEFSAALANNTLAKLATDAAHLLLVFAQDHAELHGLAPVSALARAPERWVLGKHAAYLWCANGILASKAAAALLGKAGKACTTRNWATVQKIQALLSAP